MTLEGAMGIDAATVATEPRNSLRFKILFGAMIGFKVLDF